MIMKKEDGSLKGISGKAEVEIHTLDSSKVVDRVLILASLIVESILTTWINIVGNRMRVRRKMYFSVQGYIIGRY